MTIDHYDRCRRWLDRANPEERTYAWLGMGHAFATLYRIARGLESTPTSRLSNEQEWTDHFRQVGQRLPKESLSWRVPAGERDFDLLDRVLAMSPHRIAELVQQFLVHPPYPWQPIRVRVATSLPHDERWTAPLMWRPSLRLSVSLRLDRAREKQNMPGWPLRVGTLGHGPFTQFGERAAQFGTQFAVPVTLGRRHDNCDLLLYPGDAASLMEDLARSPLQVRACMVLLGKASDPEQIRTLLDVLQSSGHVVFESEPFRRAIHGVASLADDLARGLSFDVAWSESYLQYTLPHLSDELADLTLFDIESARQRRLRGLDVLVGDSFRRTVPRGPRWKSLPEPQAPREDPYDLARRLAALAQSPRPATPQEQLEGAQRFLQQQSHNLLAGSEQPADTGFFMGEEVRVRVRIAPPAAGWQSSSAPFPRLLTEPDETVHLQICMVEPNQIGEPMWGELVLPPKGSSSTHTFDFVPRAAGAFEARLIVLHRGRVIQTALLVAQVREAGSPPSAGDAAPRLASLVRPRARIDDLRDRTAFDLAIIENHVPSGTARTVALSGSRAWVTGGAQVAEFSEEINGILSETGYEPDIFVSAADPESRRLLHRITLIGCGLYKQLMHNSLERQNTRIADIEYIQLVTAREGPTFPLEFVYDYKAPAEDATVCPSWAGSATEPQCPAGCAGGTRRVICPRGFWGISKVIERHQTSGEHATSGHDFFLQSEPDRVTGSIQLGDKFLLATSHLLNALHDSIVERMRALGAAQALQAQDWDTWETLVKQENPRLILCLPHVDGETALARLEINNDYLASVAVDRDHVAPLPDGKPPLVFLLGCDTEGAGRDYSPHVTSFRAMGAAIVVATKCVVDANQAAEAALILASELFENRSGKSTLGECLRDFRRRALAQHLLLALGVVAYGDADWHITP